MKKDKIVGYLMLITGCCALAMTLMVKIPESSISIGEPGPRLFPMIGSVLILIGGIGLVFQKAPETEPFMSKLEFRRLGQLSVVFVLYAVALYLLGFVAATPIMLYITMSMFAGTREVSKIIKFVYSFAITIMIYIVFYKLLALGLPQGLIGKIL